MITGNNRTIYIIIFLLLPIIFSSCGGGNEKEASIKKYNLWGFDEKTNNHIDNEGNGFFKKINNDFESKYITTIKNSSLLSLNKDDLVIVKDTEGKDYTYTIISKEEKPDGLLYMGEYISKNEKYNISLIFNNGLYSEFSTPLNTFKVITQDIDDLSYGIIYKLKASNSYFEVGDIDVF